MSKVKDAFPDNPEDAAFCDPPGEMFDDRMDPDERYWLSLAYELKDIPMRNPCKEINIIPLEKQSSEALAARVVAFRTLKIGKEDAIKAMQILVQRSDKNDLEFGDFDYEKYIKEKVEEISKISPQKIDVAKVLKHVKSGTF